MKESRTGQSIVMYMREGWNASSSYYRLLQYVDSISKQLNKKIEIRILITDAVVSMRYDAAGGNISVPKRIASKILYNASAYLHGIYWMSKDIVNPPCALVVLRSLYPKYCGFPVKRLYSKLLDVSGGVVWDFDDDIFENKEVSPAESEILFSKSNVITVTHDRLKNLLPVPQREKVRLIPTTDGDVHVSLQEMNQGRYILYHEEIRMVWVASSSSLPFLEHIVVTLDNAASVVKRRLGKRLTLHVVCNMPLCTHTTIQYLNIEFVKWSRDVALKELERAHIGIMPLDDTRFARGKGSFKIIQYMAAGLPSIASAVGFNNDVVVDKQTGFLASSTNDWIEGIIRLSEDFAYWSAVSQNARQRWDQCFSYDRNVRLLSNAILEAIHSEKNI